MIVNNSFGFVFIHIPKTAGTSVSQYLSAVNGPLDLEIGGTEFGECIQPFYARKYGINKHASIKKLRSTITCLNNLDDYYFFSFVRNPYQRLLSVYHFLRKWDDYNPELKNVMHRFTSFNEFVESGLYSKFPGPDGMFRPQCTWLLNAEGSVCPSIETFKVEDMPTAVNRIRAALVSRGVEPSLLQETLPHANKSAPPNQTNGAEMSPELKEKVAQYYREDFEKLGYEI